MGGLLLVNLVAVLTLEYTSLRRRDRAWLIMGIIYVKEELDPNSTWFLLKVCCAPCLLQLVAPHRHAHEKTKGATDSAHVHRERAPSGYRSCG